MLLFVCVCCTAVPVLIKVAIPEIITNLVISDAILKAAKGKCYPTIQLFFFLIMITENPKNVNKKEQLFFRQQNAKNTHPNAAIQMPLSSVLLALGAEMQEYSRCLV